MSLEQAYDQKCAECASLREQLAAMTKERDKAKAMPMKYRRMEFNAQLQNENESLRQQIADSEGLRADMQKQLAAALAACKLKDEALDKITQWDSHSIAFAVDYGSSGVQDRYRQVAREALAIHPDDSALKAWLGEPVEAIRLEDCVEGRHPSSYGIGLFAAFNCVVDLYSPKELK